VTEATTPPRSAVPVERTWDAESVFTTTEAWGTELESVREDTVGVAAFRGRDRIGVVIAFRSDTGGFVPLQVPNELVAGCVVIGHQRSLCDEERISRIGLSSALHRTSHANLRNGTA